MRNLNYAYDKAKSKAQLKAQNGALSDRGNFLLLLSVNPSITQLELATMMNKSRRPVQNRMKLMIEDGVLERAGSKRTVTWLVK